MSAGAGDAARAAMLLGRDGGRTMALGGMVLRDPELLDIALTAWRSAAGSDAPLVRVPRNVDLDRLAGGLDLAATLAAGRPVRHPGLIVSATGGLLVLAGADRLEPAIVGALAAAIDRGDCMVLAMVDDDAVVPAALAERLAFDLRAGTGDADVANVVAVDGAGDVDATGVCVIATALGVHSARAMRATLRTAVLLAATLGREAALRCAAQLVLAHRATQLPEAASPPPEREDAPDPQGGQADGAGALADRVLEAVAATLPADLDLAGHGAAHPSNGARGRGERRRSPRSGRAIGAQPGVPRGGLRLALVDTLRAAAPWQRLRGRSDARLRIARADLRVRRFENRAEATTIFAVDASGSSAVARLAEAKGAVELLLARAYVRRAEVALIAFRGECAELLLPPTRSLTRARRALAELPGGGGTPMAAGIGAAHAQAEAAAAHGRTPFVVVLSDGRANVALDGSRATAAADAEAAARAFGQTGIAAAFVDISARPRIDGERLAGWMRARYVALPRGDAQALHAAVRTG
ncbi:VWA domain-containing protein [Sphingomonas baiyangensis]|uniref:VWA domain-containing protein n=1 Tax=Sphingomonas baiyangensis TaxID=2572576 RepID=A0A4U1L285_9SPHN|nr:VWA domain-containing protein [Sphingomonas baiyangensis]TKD50959.1 VWA domain-containing protein [Sphingomonas baiyangensis]